MYRKFQPGTQGIYKIFGTILDSNLHELGVKTGTKGEMQPLNRSITKRAKATGELVVVNDDIQVYEYIAQELAEEIAEIEPQGIFTGIYFVLKKIVKTLQSLDCALNELLPILSLPTLPLAVVKLTKKYKHFIVLVNAVKDIIETSKAIGGLNEAVCSNDHGSRGVKGVVSNVVGGVKLGHKCSSNMFRKLLRLARQIKRAIKLIIQIKNVPGDTSKCVLDAVDNVEKYFTQFPANIKACTKLPSNYDYFLNKYDIIETSKAIGGLNEAVCSNDHGSRGVKGVVSKVVGGVKLGHKCSSNMFLKLLRLARQIKRAIKLIIQIKNVPGDTSKCVLDAVDNKRRY
ncbi:hypothetical protein CVS40_5316 [Lucilia cuprina]|nr:hypothetical protein CVS40_5316 [Lucilia cuprina]